MGKIKKLKGGFDLFVTEDEKLLVTSNNRNLVYVYDLETGEEIGKNTMECREGEQMTSTSPWVLPIKDDLLNFTDYWKFLFPKLSREDNDA